MAGMVLASNTFDVKLFKKRLATVSYHKEAAKRVLKFKDSIEALPGKDFKLLNDCIQSSALNAPDQDSTLDEFLSEITGCLNVYQNVAESVKKIANSFYS